MPQISDPRVLVDASTRDDAAVFRLSDDRALVATVDFFAPIVDDPYAFGAIAAANAFSDLYAMGAIPLLALNIVAWPRQQELLDLLGEVLRGGADTAAIAGALILGGHTIDDPEPKYGMVAIGEVHPEKVITNAGAKPGDHLVLTKAIGTGILSTALKRDLLDEAALEPAVRSMKALNESAASAMRATGDAVHAATDVTGFGLLGHLGNMLRASGVGARLNVASVPVFHGVREAAEKGAIPGGTERNRKATDQFTLWSASVPDLDRIILNDAQTSGGLLIAVDSSRAAGLVATLRYLGEPVTAAVIGEITAKEPGTIGVTE